MGFSEWIKDAKQEIDDRLTDATGDGDYTITTDESTITKPKDDGRN